jgi:hypothetical protein
MTRIRSLLTGAAMVVLAVTAGALPTSATPTEKPLPIPSPGVPDTDESGVSPLACAGHPHSNKDSRNGRFFDGNNVAIRIGPHLPVGCTINGFGQLSHNVDYHCFAPGDTVTRNGETHTTWTFLRDATTGVQGWVSDAFLDRNASNITTRGSLVPC